MVSKIVSLVDDDTGFGELIKTIFERSKIDIEFIFFTSGEELVTWANQFYSEHVVVLLDLNMPNMRGIEVAKHLRDSGIYWPVVIFTSSPYEEDIEEAYRVGVNSYIKKPYGLNELRKCLTNFIEYWFNYCELP